MSRIMAIDWGRKRCGLAVTDPEQIIASPLTTVDTNRCVAFLKQYLSKEKVEKIVLGYPKDLKNTQSATTLQVEQFQNILQGHFPALSIIRFDERFTSKMAAFSISQSNLPKHKKQQKGLIDKVSAAILLQDYLKAKKSISNP